MIGAHWRERERFVLLVASAAAADIAADIDHWIARWRADPQRPRRLHLIVVDDAALPGFVRQPMGDAALTVDLLHAPLERALAQLQARIDGVVLAGAILGTNLEPTHASNLACSLARLLSRDAVLQAASPMPASLLQALFATGWVAGSEGTLRFATRKPIAPAPPPPVRRAIVIGAGLAGAAACERLCARGWQVTLIERHGAAAMEASGNLAGITMPLLSKDDNQASRLSRAAFLYAGGYWKTLGGVGSGIAGAHCGVLLAARDAANGALQRAIAAARALPASYAAWFEADAARARFGAVAPHGAWWFADGGWIRPASAIAAMIAACGAHLATCFGVGDVHLARADDGVDWQVRDAAGTLLASAPTVIVASGGGAIAQCAHLPLERVRGQVTHLDAASTSTVAALPFVLCREAYLTPAAGGVISAGATYDADADPALRQSSQDHNLENMRSMLADPTFAHDAPLAGRVGFRAVATDRLPMVGAVPDPLFTVGAERLRDLPRQAGLYALLGYASRGLTWAPLAAELLAASLEGEPLPLEAELVAALDPGRFLLRQRRTQGARLR